MACVLLVDDDPYIREATALRLQVDGHHVIAVSDTRAAVEVVADSVRNGPQFDVAVLDVETPGVDEEALRELRRADDVSATLPVVFYTGNPAASGAQNLSLADRTLLGTHPLARLLATIASVTPASHNQRLTYGG